MQRNVLGGRGGVVLLALAWLGLHAQDSAVAQTWSGAEREVIESLMACQQAWQAEDLEAEMACYHNDFLGWANDMPALRDKRWLRVVLPLEHAAQDMVSWSIQPLGVRVFGNVAVVHYYLYALTRDKAGKETPARLRWTDVVLKQGNRWVWVADHGGADPGTKPIGNR